MTTECTTAAKAAGETGQGLPTRELRIGKLAGRTSTSAPTIRFYKEDCCVPPCGTRAYRRSEEQNAVASRARKEPSGLCDELRTGMRRRPWHMCHFRRTHTACFLACTHRS